MDGHDDGEGTATTISTAVGKRVCAQATYARDPRLTSSQEFTFGR